MNLALRTKLALYYIGFFAAALIVLGIGLFLLVRQSLISSIDSELRTTTQALQQNFADSNELIQTYVRTRQLIPPPSVQNFSETNLSIEVYAQDQTRLTSSTGGASTSVPVEPTIFQRVLDDQSIIFTSEHDNRQVRVSLAPLTFRSRVVGVLQVSRSMKTTDQALQLFAYALAGGGVIVLLAAARGGTWLTRAAFKPIDEITRTAQSIVGAEDLSRRVPVPAAQDELQRLTVTINDLLGRLDGLFSAQRRFVADVSHELRTPLAAMQGNLEILERGAVRDPQMLDESLTDMRREVNRLIRMVNDLLLLARSEAGLQLRHEPVELDTLLLEVHRELRPLAQGVQLRIGEEDQVVVMGDRDRLKQALLNLGINAIQHTSTGGSVTLSLSDGDGKAHLSVADTGTGIPAEELTHIFDRFYRVDAARSGGGAGLGLAIVKWIAEAHGGTVAVESTPGQGSVFTLYLPLHRDPTLPTLQSLHNHQHVAR